MLRRLHDEEGVALIAALLAVIILSGIAVVLVSTAVSQSRVTGSERDFELAIHAAEGGADEVVSILNANKTYLSQGANQSNPIELDQATYDTEVEQRQWAVDIICGHATSLADCHELEPIESGPRAESFGFRPQDDDSNEPMDVVFGVSFVPDRAVADKVRVVKLQYDRRFFTPKYGLQACGDLNIAGNATVDGTFGSVQSNGNVNINGSTYSIEEELISSGSITGDTSNAGAIEPFSPDEFCPEIRASDFYANSQAPSPYSCYDPDTGCTQLKHDDEPILWWDLCPGGTIRKAGSTPCTGSVWWSGETNSFNGWKFQNNKWQAPNGLQTGVYYIYRGNGDVNGGGGRVTVLLEADPNDGGTTGNFSLRGNGVFDPAIEKVLFAADRDIEMSGSAGGGGLQLEGFVSAYEQIKLDGTATMGGAIYAQDHPHTASSPVAVTTLKGNYTINHNEDIPVPVTGLVRITAWNELRKN